jgi:hypothetical protein
VSAWTNLKNDKTKEAAVKSARCGKKRVERPTPAFASTPDLFPESTGISRKLPGYQS